MCLTYCSFAVNNDAEQSSIGLTIIYSHLSDAKLSKSIVMPKKMIKINRDSRFYNTLNIN